MSYSQRQSGNAIVIILVAIALFGALAFTFMRGNKSGQGNLTSQKAKVISQEIVSYASQLQRTFDKLRQRGCSETQISFYNLIWQNKNGTLMQIENPNAPLDKSCHIFEQNGGGMTPIVFPAEITINETFPAAAKLGTPFIRVLKILGVGSDTDMEIVLVINYLTETACRALNQSTQGNGILPAVGDGKAGWNAFYWLKTSTGVLGDEDTSLVGKRAFCWNNSTDASYTFAYTLFER